MIHDRYYARPPATFGELRWRIQHIAEEELGKRVRNAVATENAVAAEMSSRLS